MKLLRHKLVAIEFTISFILVFHFVGCQPSSGQHSVNQASESERQASESERQASESERQASEFEQAEFTSTTADAKVRFKSARRLTDMQPGLIDESSGLAASINHADCYWTHNDNGHVGGPFLIDAEGRLLVQLKLQGVPFRDWEALDCREIDGTNYLIVADVGDNLSRYPTCRIYIFPEPGQKPEATNQDPPTVSVNDVVTLEFTYPDGPVDCEAMAVDAKSRTIYLISKSRNLQGQQSETKIHTLPWPDKAERNATESEEPIRATKLDTDFGLPMVTGMDFSPDGTLAVVRSYIGLRMYQRDPQQTWDQVFNTPMAKPVGCSILPLQRQGEAICFESSEKSILLTSEGSGQPIWQIDFLFDTDKQP